MTLDPENWSPLMTHLVGSLYGTHGNEFIGELVFNVSPIVHDTACPFQLPLSL